MVKPKRQTLSQRAKLLFPVARVGKMLRGRYSRRVSEAAAVYMTASLEYLVTELVSVSATEQQRINETKSNRRTRIPPRTMMLAVRRDAELDELFRDATISAAGVPSTSITASSRRSAAKRGVSDPVLPVAEKKTKRKTVPVAGTKTNVEAALRAVPAPTPRRAQGQTPKGGKVATLKKSTSMKKSAEVSVKIERSVSGQASARPAAASLFEDFMAAAPKVTSIAPADTAAVHASAPSASALVDDGSAPHDEPESHDDGDDSVPPPAEAAPTAATPPVASPPTLLGGDDAEDEAARRKVVRVSARDVAKAERVRKTAEAAAARRSTEEKRRLEREATAAAVQSARDAELEAHDEADRRRAAAKADREAQRAQAKADAHERSQEIAGAAEKAKADREAALAAEKAEKEAAAADAKAKREEARAAAKAEKDAAAALAKAERLAAIEKERAEQEAAEAALLAEQEAKRQAEADAIAQAEAEKEAQRVAAEEAKAAAAAKRKQEAADRVRLKTEKIAAEAKARAEAEAKKKAEADAAALAAADAKRKREEEEARRRAEAEARAKAAAFLKLSSNVAMETAAASAHLSEQQLKLAADMAARGVITHKWQVALAPDAVGENDAQWRDVPADENGQAEGAYAAHLLRSSQESGGDSGTPFNFDAMVRTDSGIAIQRVFRDD